jgi:hypothetical protein
MGKHGTKEQQRLYVERLLETDSSVAEWCARNKIPRQTIYHWLNTFAETEPELFGGRENIADRTGRRWVESTRANIRASKSLARKEPSCGVVIVDTLFAEQVPGTTATNRTTPDAICVKLNEAAVSIPPGSAQSDICAVLKVVARL